MNEMFNIYCDESCHLENDRQPVMLLGCVWCPLTEVPRLAAELRDIKERHRATGELKWFFPEKEDGKEVVFWHLTSRKDNDTGERLPDLRRSERLPWARPMLDYPDKPDVLDWDYEEDDGTVKTYVWPPECGPSR